MSERKSFITFARKRVAVREAVSRWNATHNTSMPYQWAWDILFVGREHNTLDATGHVRAAGGQLLGGAAEALERLETYGGALWQSTLSQQQQQQPPIVVPRFVIRNSVFTPPRAQRQHLIVDEPVPRPTIMPIFSSVCCMCLVNHDILLPLTRGCSCEACPDCIVRYVTITFSQPYPRPCICAKAEGIVFEHALAHYEVPESRPQHPTDIDGHVPSQVLKMLDPEMICMAIELAASTIDTSTAKRAVALQLQALASKYPTAAVNKAGACPKCKNGWGIEMKCPSGSAARCTSASCACLYCVKCNTPINHTHWAEGCPITHALPLSLSSHQCPVCSVHVDHFYKHGGCHEISCNCGTKWCFVCRQILGSSHCACPIYCDETCRCPRCPECKPGSHCSDCDKHCL